jgi:hypothetical protein
MLAIVQALRAEAPVSQRVWGVQNQAGHSPLRINDLRNHTISFVRLPKLDVPASSPVAHPLDVLSYLSACRSLRAPVRAPEIECWPQSMYRGMCWCMFRA